VLSERPLGTLVQLSGWRDSFEAAASAVLRRLGFAGVGEFDRAQVVVDGVAFRIAPERVLLHLASPSVWQPIAAGVDPALTPVLDLSHARTLVTVAGDDAPALLGRVLPIDFDGTAFPPGHFAQSAIHAVAMLVHRPAVPSAAGFEVYLPRSFAASIWNVLAGNATPFGYRVDARR
jgi:heterotetrameric sarcosine oxidase gamma subunit